MAGYGRRSMWTGVTPALVTPLSMKTLSFSSLVVRRAINIRENKIKKKEEEKEEEGEM